MDRSLDEVIRRKVVDIGKQQQKPRRLRGGGRTVYRSGAGSKNANDRRPNNLNNPNNERNRRQNIIRNKNGRTVNQNQGRNYRNHDNQESATPLWDTPNRSSRQFGRLARLPRGRSLEITGLEFSIMKADLEELFSSVGDVVDCWVNYDRTDRSDGTGGVIFQTAASAQTAQEKLNGSVLEGDAIKLKLV